MKITELTWEGVKEGVLSRLYRVITMISPTWNTKLRYKRIMGKPLNLKNPTTFNEKFSWLKLNVYMRHPLVIQCADKVAVRDFVRDRGCAELLTKLYAVYDRPDDIDWEALPKSFAMKWNYGAYKNIICDKKESLTRESVVKEMKQMRKDRYWLRHAELQYKYAKKRILVEEYIGKENGDLPEDYKFFCLMEKLKLLWYVLGEREPVMPGIVILIVTGIFMIMIRNSRKRKQKGSKSREIWIRHLIMRTCFRKVFRLSEWICTFFPTGSCLVN